MIAERFDIHEQVAEMHSMLAEYHRKLAREARLDIVHDYHVDLAQRLADEATQIPRRAATLARFHETRKTSNSGAWQGRSHRSRCPFVPVIAADTTRLRATFPRGALCSIAAPFQQKSSQSKAGGNPAS